MAKKAISPCIMRLEKVKGKLDFFLCGSIRQRADLLTDVAMNSKSFEQALNLAILQIREAKSAEQG